MKTSYLAIGYACNQKCSFCPCSKEEAKYPFIPLVQLRAAVDEMIQKSCIEAIVISGGEPSLHPDFIPFVSYLTERDLCVNILSNAERFSDNAFIENIRRHVDTSLVNVVTTIHSQNPEEHERINGTKNSFSRTIQGLNNLLEIGAHITIKHCITAVNHKELTPFYRFIDASFPPEVDIQLCSIDYCGLGDDKYDHMLSFPELAKYLEDMFDCYIADTQRGSARHLYAINMPLCACDPCYWELIAPKTDTYSSYASPDEVGNADLTLAVESNVGAFGVACKNCKAEPVCPGTYRTAFEYFGDKIIRAYTD